MSLFKNLYSSGMIPNKHIFPTILVACSVAGSSSGGKVAPLAHNQIRSQNVFLHREYSSGFLCEIWAAGKLLSYFFRRWTVKIVVAWNTVISGYSENGDLVRAVELLQRMMCEGIAPNTYTYSIALSLCVDLPILGWGQETHSHMVKSGFDNNIIMGSSLINMYAKYGRLNDAHKVFDKLFLKNLVSWNIMLGGYAQHGFGREALEIYTMIQREGIASNDVTFIGVLSVCAHVGLVKTIQAFLAAQSSSKKWCIQVQTYMLFKYEVMTLVRRLIGKVELSNTSRSSMARMDGSDDSSRKKNPVVKVSS